MNIWAKLLALVTSLFAVATLFQNCGNMSSETSVESRIDIDGFFQTSSTFESNTVDFGSLNEVVSNISMQRIDVAGFYCDLQPAELEWPLEVRLTRYFRHRGSKGTKEKRTQSERHNAEVGVPEKIPSNFTRMGCQGRTRTFRASIPMSEINGRGDQRIGDSHNYRDILVVDLLYVRKTEAYQAGGSRTYGLTDGLYRLENDQIILVNVSGNAGDKFEAIELTSAQSEAILRFDQSLAIRRVFSAQLPGPTLPFDQANDVVDFQLMKDSNEPNPGPCVNIDSNGWGHNGFESCRLEDELDSNSPPANFASCTGEFLRENISGKLCSEILDIYQVTCGIATFVNNDDEFDWIQLLRPVDGEYKGETCLNAPY